MKRIGLIALLLTGTGVGHASEMVIVELPWGTQMEMEMVWIEPGTFAMGTTQEQKRLLRRNELWLDWFSNEQPVHQVTISRGFYLGKYEITQGQWKSVMSTSPWLGWEDMRVDDRNPAAYISWNDMQMFIQVLNKAAGDSLYRLPTEAEWEYACRAKTNSLWSFGDDRNQWGDYAWYDENARDVGEKYAHQVGTKLPNPWGLYDMHGNVWEWCQDWYGPYSNGSKVDPFGPAAGIARVGRGGCFYDNARTARSAFRNRSEPDLRYGIIGARLLKIK